MQNKELQIKSMSFKKAVIITVSFNNIVTNLHIFGTDCELSGTIPVINCRNIIIERSVVTSKPIFSPLSGGKKNPRILIADIRTHGNIKLNIK
jgi:hypothetical protein